MSKKQYNHAFDLAFEVKSGEEKGHKVDAEAVLQGMQQRVDYLRAHPDEVHEACNNYNSSEEEERESKFRVTVEATYKLYATVTVEAEDSTEARAKALEHVEESIFMESPSRRTYDTTGCEEL